MSFAWKTRALRIGRFAVSCWLVVHVFCVFIAPAAMPPSSPLLEDGFRLALPYNEALFLNHGYHYFAPDPGGSTLYRYSIDRPGDVPVSGRFPNRAIRPRLRYHRYFMLAENLWAFDDGVEAELQKAYAREFARRHDATRIELFRISHEPSSIVRIQAGGRLNDPEMFSEESVGTFVFPEDSGSILPVGIR